MKETRRERDRERERDRKENETSTVMYTSLTSYTFDVYNTTLCFLTMKKGAIENIK